MLYHYLSQVHVPQACRVEGVLQKERYLTCDGITHHPASYGLAERVVQMFTEAMRKQLTGSWDVRIANFLFTYRLTIHATTNHATAKIAQIGDGFTETQH